MNAAPHIPHPPRVAASPSSMAAVVATAPSIAITIEQIDRFSLTADRVVGALVLAQIELDGESENVPIANTLGLAEEAIKALRDEISGLSKQEAR